MTLRICKKRRSVLEAPGHCLVLGGPGSGKTTLALLKAVKRIGEDLAAGQEVLFLSFSRAAVARIAEAAKVHTPLPSRSALSLQTFHSFFWQILKGHGYLLGCPRHLSVLLAHDEKAMCNGISPGDLGWESWVSKRREMFHRDGLVCFDLFAPLTAEILRRSSRIRNRVSSRYPLIIVDEAQDTGDEQWECVRLLAGKSQVVCLADPNQMIYDFLPGVGPGRIAEIRTALGPLEIDLEIENNRSAGTEIAVFARDVLAGKVRGSAYKGVSRHYFGAGVANRNREIRRSVGILYQHIKKQTLQTTGSVAIIAAYSKGVAIISAALQLPPHPIVHRVLFDEAFALLSSRAAAFLLEPKDATKHAEDVALLLELVGRAQRAKGTKTALELSAKCVNYAASCRKGSFPKTKIVTAAGNLVASARARRFIGNPRKDWITVKQDMGAQGEDVFRSMAASLDYLVAFAQGLAITEGLSALWMEHGNYLRAREVLHTALSQEQLLSAAAQMHGIHVMNMHKCKGKQFDGIVLYREQYTSPFVWAKDTEPYASSRRLLHMAITRARFHVLILDEAISKCPILDPHTL